MTDKPTVTADDLRALLLAEQKPTRKAADDDVVSEYAIAALATLRGLNRGDKLRVIRRMSRMLGSEARRRRTPQAAER